jgi:hypothetical protein
MSAKLFFLPYSTATVNGIAQPGAQLFFYQTGTLTKLPIYTTDLLDVQLTNPVTATGAGRFADVYLDSTQTYRLIVKDRLGATLDDIDPYIPGTVEGLVVGNESATANTRGELAAMIGGTGSNAMAFLTESGREGMFVWAIGDQSAYVTADTAQGVYVAPAVDTTGASGAWVRIPAGKTGYMGTATIDLTHTVIIEGESCGHYGVAYSSALRFAAATTGIRIQAYNTSGASTVDGATHFSGAGSIVRGVALYGGFVATEGEYHGIHAKQRFTLEDFLIYGFAGDGIHVDCTAGSAGADEGNSNLFRIKNGAVVSCRDGIIAHGADANAGSIENVDFTGNRAWGANERSFLGNTYIACHTSANGTWATKPSWVSQGGQRYTVIAGQETGASTNAPKSSTVTITIASPGVVSWTAHGLVAGTPIAFSTTGALPTGLAAATTYYVLAPNTNDFTVSATVGGAAINTSGSQSGVHTIGVAANNTWWLWTGIGGVNVPIGIPAWLSGQTYRAGGAYHSDNANGQNVLLNCYSEGDQPPAQLSYPTNVIGGLHGAQVMGSANYVRGLSGQTSIGPTTGAAADWGLLINATSTQARIDFETWSGGTGTLSGYIASLTANAMVLNHTNNVQLSVAGVPIAAAGASYFYPATDNSFDLGFSSGAFRWRNVYAMTANLSTSITIGGGTALTKAVVYTPTLTPASVAAATVAEQTFTVTGLTTADKVIVNPPAIGNATGIAGARVSAADTLAIRFVNPTAGALTPTSGSYVTLAFRS